MVLYALLFAAQLCIIYFPLHAVTKTRMGVSKLLLSILVFSCVLLNFFYKRRSSLVFLQIKMVKIEAVAQRCFVKKVFLEILQNSQENTCARAFFNKVAGLKLLL